MDYKEKVRLAKEALESGSYDKETIEYIFPELKESEDEKIRKELITHCRNTRCVTEEGAERIVKWISWLEKQGKLMKCLQIANSKIGDLIEENYYLRENLDKQGEQNPVIKMKTPEESLGIDSDTYNKIVDECIYGEQKPDKVEPRFKIGEWITNSDYTWQIVNVSDLDYILQSQNEHIVYDTISHVDEQFHSFTIQDAKAGDVLAVTMYPEGTWIGIFKEQNGCTFSSYCFVNTEGIFKKGTYGHGNGRAIHPATKEQRDQLEKAMADAGYTFNFDKKELRKSKFRVGDIVKSKSQPMLYARKIISIGKDCYWCEDRGCIGFAWEDDYEIVEQKPTELPKGEARQEELTEFEKAVKQVMEEAIECGDTHNLKADADMLLRLVQKSSWSEEDIELLDNTIKFIEDSVAATPPSLRTYNPTLTGKEIPFLKALKDRVQPKQEWSDVDKDILCRTIDNLKFLRDTISIDPKYAINIIDIEREITWLNSLRPQNKTYYWTENEIKFAISDFIRGAESYEKMVEKLRCLKPQTTWKPSGEQMLAINTAINVLGKGTINGKYLIELQKQLKKLREK